MDKTAALAVPGALAVLAGADYASLSYPRTLTSRVKF